MSEFSSRIRAAQNSEGADLWDAIRSQHPDVMFNAVMNRNLTEDMALYIVKSKSAPAEALTAISSDVRFAGSYKIKLALCRNPRTPQRVALSMLKFLRIFDLGDLTRNQRVPVMLRQKVELMLTERIPALPVGVKVALSRRVSGVLVVRIMEKGEHRVINACLDSQLLTEDFLYKLVLRKATKPLIIKAVAEHPVWSLRYALRFSLVRNFHTPMSNVVSFIRSLKALDLKTLYSDPKVPAATKPFIYRELLERGETTEIPEEIVYEIHEEDLEDESGYLEMPSEVPDGPEE